MMKKAKRGLAYIIVLMMCADMISQLAFVSKASANPSEAVTPPAESSVNEKQPQNSSLGEGMQKEKKDDNDAYGNLTDIGAEPVTLSVERSACTDADCASKHVAAIGDTHYATLQDAFDDAPGGTETTVTMLKDIAGMETGDIATVKAGKNIIFDMKGYSITVDASFRGRPIVNEGTLTVTGDGNNKIDSSNGESGGWGAIKNNSGGTLTIENGSYIGSVYGDGSAIRNFAGATLIVKGGYFAATRAVANTGDAIIYKGEFETLSCSGCILEFGYALTNLIEGAASCTMLIAPKDDGDVKVHGPQGALSVTGGCQVTVNGGTFYSHPCTNSHARNTCYALYVSGRKGIDAATCVINGGKFSTTGPRACVYLQNTNSIDNGGDPGDAVIIINNGSFEQGQASGLINIGGASYGLLEVHGGIFQFSGNTFAVPDVGVETYVWRAEDISKYVATDMQLKKINDNKYEIVSLSPPDDPGNTGGGSSDTGTTGDSTSGSGSTDSGSSGSNDSAPTASASAKPKPAPTPAAPAPAVTEPAPAPPVIPQPTPETAPAPVQSEPAPAVPARPKPAPATPAKPKPAPAPAAIAPVDENAPDKAEESVTPDGADKPLAEESGIAKEEIETATESETDFSIIEDEAASMAADSGRNWILFSIIPIAVLVAGIIFILIRRKKEEQ